MKNSSQKSRMNQVDVNVGMSSSSSSATSPVPKDEIERQLSESHPLSDPSADIVISPRIHHLVQGLNISPENLQMALKWLRSSDGAHLAFDESFPTAALDICTAIEALGFPRPEVTFGCNNDSKRMYKFGNADGATPLDAHDEFKDNSEDAGALITEYNYDESTRVYTFGDNGSGMGLDKLREFSNLDSHNPDRDDTSTSGQHGIGGPRRLTWLARPKFDRNYRVTSDS